MIFGVILAILAFLGIMLLIVGIRGVAPPPLKKVYEGLQGPGRAQGRAQEDFRLTQSGFSKLLNPSKKSKQGGVLYKFLERIINAISEGLRTGDKAKQLALVGKDPAEHAQQKLLSAGGTAAFLIILISMVIFSGVININFIVAIFVGLIGGAIGYWLPDNVLKTNSDRLRREFNEAMYIWIDLTTQFLSTGEDGAAAMIKASALSDIWPFRLLNSSLTLSQLRARPAHEGLRDLSQQRGLDNLKGLIEAMELSSDYGTEMSEVIRSFVQSFRTQAVIDAEARVEATSEQSALPLGLVIVGFLILLAYPGVQGVLSSGLEGFSTTDVTASSDG